MDAALGNFRHFCFPRDRTIILGNEYLRILVWPFRGWPEQIRALTTAHRSYSSLAKKPWIFWSAVWRYRWCENSCTPESHTQGWGLLVKADFMELCAQIPGSENEECPLLPETGEEPCEASGEATKFLWVSWVFWTWWVWLIIP